ncbi:MAG: c-type cytochrome, partial [Polyangiaceae bacterium]
GMAVRHGMMKPPSFHQDRLRHLPDGQIFATISNGVRNMPEYGPQIPVRDRWAIVSYVRALQISQAPLAAEMKQ